MKKIIAILVFGIGALGFQSASFAADSAKATYKATVKQADIDYKVAKAKCDEQKGNDKDVCLKEAKAAHTTTIANAKADRKSKNAHKEAREDTNSANYATAKEKCDAMKGDAKDSCINSARTQYKQ
ncbi:MAG TPA: cell envelope biogenesis protein TolA [Herbaspirillum sp.]|jgi:hypothetical protein|nr:cell envelope biogenesis protein TolA [Herbaspirillum sp.]